jgi:hypothetical protein
MNTSPFNTAARPDRKTLIRDVAMFQVKLVVDGLRDLVLLPAALIAGLISFLHTEGESVGPEFYRVISVGKQSEDWIDLFGAVDNAPPDVADDVRFADVSLDDLVSRIETYVVEEYRRGGVTAQAKSRISQLLEKLRNTQA